MAKKKVTIPKNENKRDKFKRVFTPKVNKALSSIRLIGNGAGAAYEPTAEDVAGMLAKLREEVDALEERYTSKGSSKGGFSFD